jgi:hypothetical protein
MSAKSTNRKLQVSTGLLSNDDADFHSRSLGPVGQRESHVAIEMQEIKSPDEGAFNDEYQNFGTSTFTETKTERDIKEITSTREDPVPRKVHVNSNGRDSCDHQNIVNQSREKENSFQSEALSSSPSVTLPGSAGSGKITELDIPTSRVNSSRSGGKSGNEAFDDSDYYCVDHMKLCSSQVGYMCYVTKRQLFLILFVFTQIFILC